MKILYAGPGEVLVCKRCGFEVPEETCPDGELDYYFCEWPCLDFVDVRVVKATHSASCTELGVRLCDASHIPGRL